MLDARIGDNTGAKRRALRRWFGNLPRQLVTGKSPSLHRLIAEEKGEVSRAEKESRLGIGEMASVRKVALKRWLSGFPQRFYSRRAPTFKILVEQEQGRRLSRRLSRLDKPLVESLSGNQRQLYNYILRRQRRLSALTKRTKAGEESKALYNGIGLLSGELYRLRQSFKTSLSAEQKRLLEDIET